MKIENPFITIAGQTAPGGGILLRGQKFYVAADHVIIRHVRFRLGPVSGKDAVAITNGARNVIIDHCSVSWGSDETLSVDTNASDITIQWGIISEGLNFEDHPYGSLIGAGPAVSPSITISGPISGNDRPSCKVKRATTTVTSSSTMSPKGRLFQSRRLVPSRGPGGH